MNFHTAAQITPKTTRVPEHPEFSRLIHAVASGKLTVDAAWKEWQEYCQVNGIPPVQQQEGQA